MTKLEFKEELQKHNIVLTDKMLNQFEQYYELLKQYNEVMDLTNVIDEEAVYDRHFFNSLTIAFQQDFNHCSLCDVGSGAGFPAIPLKIVFPEMKLTIVDSLSKRMDFLKIVIDKLELKYVTIIPKRVEEVATTLKEQFDIVTARAVARVNILIELCCQLIKINGQMIAMKGEKALEELSEASHALQCCHMRYTCQRSYPPSCNLYFIKEKRVSSKYPRLYSIIKKSPL